MFFSRQATRTWGKRFAHFSRVEGSVVPSWITMRSGSFLLYGMLVTDIVDRFNGHDMWITDIVDRLLNYGMWITGLL